MNSSKTEKCKGCRHITDNQDEFCYMFAKEPKILPCAQHDKFKEQRRINGRKIHERFMNGT